MAYWKHIVGVMVTAVLLLVAALVAVAFYQGVPGRPAPVAQAYTGLAVNGFPELTARRYDEVAYATTHNAMSNRDAGFFFPNQMSSMRKQLEDGVRALMIDIHPGPEAIMLCHGPCEMGSQKLVDGLAEIREFLDTHPNEVVTLILEQYVDSNDMALDFADSGILRYAHAQELGAPWPTLGEMVASGERLVVFTPENTAGLPWLLPMWDFMWDTDWNIQSADQFDCECNRGRPDHELMVLNNFISNPLPMPGNAEIANAREFLLNRATGCARETGRIPNFVTVDYYEIGDVFGVVNALNGVGPA